MNLYQYVTTHAQRGACQCGQCIDRGPDVQLQGHTVDLVFFEVSNNGADADTLRKLISEHRWEYADCNPLDGKEHSYIELGAWIGDQGVAMMFMGLCAILGLAKLLTPRTVLGGLVDDAMALQMAGQGLVVIKSVMGDGP